MFTEQQNRDITDKVQAIIRDINSLESPTYGIHFSLYIDGSGAWGWSYAKSYNVVASPESVQHDVRVTE